MKLWRKAVLPSTSLNIEFAHLSDVKFVSTDRDDSSPGVVIQSIPDDSESLNSQSESRYNSALGLETWR